MTDGFVKSGGNSAFPRAEGETTPALEGMTLRDYFAGQALAGLTAALANDPDFDLRVFLVADCYRIADEMLEERNQ